MRRNLLFVSVARGIGKYFMGEFNWFHNTQHVLVIYNAAIPCFSLFIFQGIRRITTEWHLLDKVFEMDIFKMLISQQSVKFASEKTHKHLNSQTSCFK